MADAPPPVDPELPAVDAVLVLSFGGPDGPDDVMPFLRNVTAGRNVPDERLAVVAEQYELFGGRSPINDQNLALIEALEGELTSAGIDLPVYFGNRNWSPYLTDTVRTMQRAGIERALVFVTSAFGSYSGCRQYQDDLAAARATVGPDSPVLEKLRLYYNHPGFLEPVARRAAAALPETARRSTHRLVFTAHSVPLAMAAACPYEAQLAEAAGLVADRLEIDRWDLVYQSRSGPPSVPWLEPDIVDHLDALASDGVERVTVVPLGFVSDHMEVQYDLDHQAATRARELGLELRRAATVGTDPGFIRMIRELIEERTVGRPPSALGPSGPWPPQCPPDHCRYQAARPG